MASSVTFPFAPHQIPESAFPNHETSLHKTHQLKTASHLLDQCSTSLRQIRQLHAHLIKTGLYQDHLVQNRLISHCIQNRSSEALDYAVLLFSHNSKPATFLQNNIIKKFAESETPEKAIYFYCSVHHNGLLPNYYTFPALIKACSRLLGIMEGKQIHAHVYKTGFESDVHVRNSMIHFYSCCGVIDSAKQVFDTMLVRDTVTWNSMIAGFSQNGLSCEALGLFREMQLDGSIPDEVTMVSVLSACAHAGAFELGKWVHAYIERNKLDCWISVKTALIDMYSKCGCIEGALEVFESIPDKNLVCWTAMINGLALNGYGRKAVEVFDQMLKSNVQPDEILYISVLSACSHSGLLEEGKRLFGELKIRYGIRPRMEHYGCMIDLLGRFGLVEEAYELIKKMPMAPNAVIWRTLLGACKVHKNVELGEIVLKEILELEPQKHGDFILLSNIYAAAGRWDDAMNVRRMMKKKKITKIPGCSMIEIDNQIYSFVVEDKSHFHSREVHKMLDQMDQKLKLAGYVPDTSKVLSNIDEEEKEKALRHHSEKVAVAFGLIRTSPGTPLRIVKNLRVCDDCHSAMKLISMIYDREVILRDQNRFHHFRKGSCSCGDYW